MGVCKIAINSSAVCSSECTTNRLATGFCTVPLGKLRALPQTRIKKLDYKGVGPRGGEGRMKHEGEEKRGEARVEKDSEEKGEWSGEKNGAGKGVTGNW